MAAGGFSCTARDGQRLHERPLMDHGAYGMPEKAGEHGTKECTLQTTPSPLCNPKPSTLSPSTLKFLLQKAP